MSGGLRPLVELCVEPAGLCGRRTGVAVPLRRSLLLPGRERSKLGSAWRGSPRPEQPLGRKNLLNPE